MPTSVEISNMALQMLGAKRITSLSEDSVSARACNVAFNPSRDEELRNHRWSNSIARIQIAADGTAPTWGRANSYTLPGDCVKVLPPYPEDDLNTRDWLIEQGKILSDETSPLYVRYMSNSAPIIDPLLARAIACRMAKWMCEELTQSNSKVATADAVYKEVLKEAKKANAIEQVPLQAPEDSWVTARA